MGDTVEFTTHPCQRREYFYLKGSGMHFQVKYNSNARIGFAIHLNNVLIYSINILGTIQNRMSDMEIRHLKFIRNVRKLKNNDNDQVEQNEFTEMWISWYGPNIQLGKGNNPTPFFNWPKRDNEAKLRFITFFSELEDGSVTWRFETRPEPPASALPTTDKNKPRWVKQRHPPPDAIIGGYENNEPLYIIRAYHGDALTPGKYVPSTRKAYVSWYEEHEEEDFEFLCGYNFKWVKCSSGDTRNGAMYAGLTELPLRGKCLYVGRAFHEGNLICGKVQPTHGCCFIPYRGEELKKNVYEVMTLDVKGSCPFYQRA